MGKLKDYLGLAILIITVLMSSCKEEEPFVPAYTNYGFVYVEEGLNAYVGLESGIRLKFDDESDTNYRSGLENGQRILLNYEVAGTVDEANYVITVLAIADVEQKDMIVHDEDNKDTIVSAYIELPSASIGSSLLNLQVAYLKVFESQETNLIYKPSFQKEGENIRLALVNEFSGEKLDDEDQTAGYDIITFDVSEIGSYGTPDEEGVILFDIVYNPNSLYEETIKGFQAKVY